MFGNLFSNKKYGEDGVMDPNMSDQQGMMPNQGMQNPGMQGGGGIGIAPVPQQVIETPTSGGMDPMKRQNVESLTHLDARANQVLQQAQSEAKKARLAQINPDIVLLGLLYDKEIYKLRHLVENAFLHLKRWRGIATRYAKTTSSFLAAVQIRCIALWAAIS